MTTRLKHRGPGREGCSETMPAMEPIAYVTALYRTCLGREPDPAGLQHWTDVITATADPTSVLASLLASKEYRARVDKTAVIHCEVEFSAIYARQPLYPEIHQHIAAENFSLMDILAPMRYHYIVDSGQAASDRLLWGEAIFFKETEDSEVLGAKAEVAAGIYGKPTLAEHLLKRSSLL